MDLQARKHLNLLLNHRSVLINMEDIQWMNTKLSYSYITVTRKVFINSILAKIPKISDHLL